MVDLEGERRESQETTENSVDDHIVNIDNGPALNGPIAVNAPDPEITHPKRQMLQRPYLLRPRSQMLQRPYFLRPRSKK